MGMRGKSKQNKNHEAKRYGKLYEEQEITSAEPEAIVTRSGTKSLGDGTATQPAGGVTQTASGAMQLGWKAWLALIVFVVQNSSGSILLRYTKAYLDDEYSSAVAVLMQASTCCSPA